MTVFLADDHPLFLEALTDAVEARPELKLIGVASDGERAATRIAQQWPDVAVLDMRLPPLDGEAILATLQHLGVPTRVVFLSAHVDSGLIYRALAAGAAGYLSKCSDRADVCEAIAAAGRGRTVLSPDVQERLAGAIRERGVTAERALTPRESTVLALAADGCSTREIATRLGVGSATVKAHLRSVYDKLDVRDRASAVAVAMRRGMLA